MNILNELDYINAVTNRKFRIDIDGVVYSNFADHVPYVGSPICFVDEIVDKVAEVVEENISTPVYVSCRAYQY
jgi:hypothetical protein